MPEHPKGRITSMFHFSSSTATPALRKRHCRFLEGVCGGRCSPASGGGCPRPGMSSPGPGQPLSRRKEQETTAKAASKSLNHQLLKFLLCQHLPLAAAAALHWLTQLSTAQLLPCSALARCHPQVTEAKPKFWSKACLPHKGKDDLRNNILGG